MSDRKLSAIVADLEEQAEAAERRAAEAAAEADQWQSTARLAEEALQASAAKASAELDAEAQLRVNAEHARSAVEDRLSALVRGVAQLLAAAGASTDVDTFDGRTAREWAEQFYALDSSHNALLRALDHPTDPIEEVRDLVGFRSEVRVELDLADPTADAAVDAIVALKDEAKEAKDDAEDQKKLFLEHPGQVLIDAIERSEWLCEDVLRELERDPTFLSRLLGSRPVPSARSEAIAAEMAVWRDDDPDPLAEPPVEIPELPADARHFAVHLCNMPDDAIDTAWRASAGSVDGFRARANAYDGPSRPPPVEARQNGKRAPRAKPWGPTPEDFRYGRERGLSDDVIQSAAVDYIKASKKTKTQPASEPFRAVLMVASLGDQSDGSGST